jgi:acetyltransferase-like isoleucine patch superfamily enzyme
MSTPRTLPWDWYSAPIPDNVVVDETAYLETSYSFHRFHSRRPDAVVLERAASVYLGTTFDLGSNARVTIGEFSLINAAQLIIDGELHVGDHVLVSWGVVVMDTYRVPVDPTARRQGEPASVRPVTIEPDCWIGFGASILPGAQLGRGSIVAARSVVAGSVDPYTVVAGNPAVPVGRQPEVSR